MGIKIKCGKAPNQSFQLIDTETGEDVTSKFPIAQGDVVISFHPRQTTKAVLQVYVDEIEVDVQELQVVENRPIVWSLDALREATDDLRGAVVRAEKRAEDIDLHQDDPPKEKSEI